MKSIKLLVLSMVPVNTAILILTGTQNAVQDHIFDLLTLGILLFGIALILQTHQEPNDGSF
jgi:hypothetical protein